MRIHARALTLMGLEVAVGLSGDGSFTESSFGPAFRCWLERRWQFCGVGIWACSLGVPNNFVTVGPRMQHARLHLETKERETKQGREVHHDTARTRSGQTTDTARDVIYERHM